MHYLADKVFVHHWPKDSPIWSDSLQKKLDVSINKNSNKKEIIIDSDIIQIKILNFLLYKKLEFLCLFLNKNAL